MKAAVYTQYGPPEVVQVQQVPMPKPGRGEVLVQVHAATVTAADWRARSLILPGGFGPLGRVMFGFSGPRQQILGSEFAGVVQDAGEGVSRFKTGDRVFGVTGLAMGAHAEFVVMDAEGPIAAMPENLNFGEAAALSFGGTAALCFLRDRGKVQAGETVLVNGASGNVGSACVQIARHLGGEVTGVCSGGNADLVRAIGADHVIDYTRTDFTETGMQYDVIVDCAGTAPFSRSAKALKPGGRLLAVLGTAGDMLKAPFQSMISGKKVIAGPAEERREDLETLAELARNGAYKPVIDGAWPLEQIAVAHSRVDSGRKRGSAVVTMPAAQLARIAG